MWVEKLAGLKCSALGDLYQPGEEQCEDHCSHDYHQEYRCKLCQGTRALVPGLWQECPCIRLPGAGRPEDGYDCWSCHRAYTHKPNECLCEGRGWVLIPEEEQMGVLMDYAGVHEWVLIIGDGHLIMRYGSDSRPRWKSKESTLPERLAHAICQARGIGEVSREVAES
jgi:hypothetical protein